MWTPTRRLATRAGGGWWSATVRPRPGRSRVGRAQWRCERRGCTTSGSMPRASASGSPAGSFRPTCAGPPRWPRCCRFSISAGLSTGDFREALPVLLGDDAAGLSATNIARLTAVWEDEYRQFRQRDLADRDYVYVWVDGIHFNIRLEDDRLCTLVVIGARADGTKELVALEDGYRESAESWAELLRGLQRRGLEAPVVAVGDGALGFWSAVRDVWPQTAEQRDWFHKLGNVLDKLPKRLQPKAKRALHDILAAETREQAEEHLDIFVAEYEAKYPKAAACLATDREALLTFFAFPADHWIHLRTTNVIESPFATVRLRQRVTKGAGSRTKGLLMAYKLLDMAQRRWRRLNAAHLLPLVRAGVVFIDGVQQEPNTEEDRKEAA